MMKTSKPGGGECPLDCGRPLVYPLPAGLLSYQHLNTIKNLQEVCTIYCATANPVDVIIAETSLGRGILEVIDGEIPRGIEGPSDVASRKEVLRKFGYTRG